MREWLAREGLIRSKVVEGKEAAGEKFRDYFDHAEPLAKIPSHRMLALLRGRREEFLQLDLDPGADAEAGHQYAEGRIALHAGIDSRGRPADTWLRNAVRLAKLSAWAIAIGTALQLVCLLMGGKERNLEHRMDAWCQGMFGEVRPSASCASKWAPSARC